MKKKNQQGNVVDFSSIAAKRAEIKNSVTEHSQLQECPHCVIENSIEKALEIALVRTRVLKDESLKITAEERLSIIKERDSLIFEACLSVANLHHFYKTN